MAERQSQTSDTLRQNLGWLSRRRFGLFILAIIIFVLIWELITRLTNIPAFILPSPGQVWERFVQVVQDGTLFRHISVTMLEVGIGLSIGVVFATTLGYLLAKSALFDRLLSPFVVASQAVPIVAIAPLLVLWFGPGMTSKVLVTALTVFFPVLINTVVGIRGVPDELRDLMRSLLATHWQTIRHLEVPAALPVFLGGLRIGATLAVIGAVVGEFVGADRGLGFLVNLGRGQYDTALVLVAVFTLVFLALSLYGLVVLAESRLLAWRQRPEDTMKG